MRENTSVSYPLDGTAAGRLFLRQRDEYSCGPACLASAAALYNIATPDYDKFRTALNPNPVTGSDNLDMAAQAEKYLPFVSAGEDIYQGGIAIANIIQEEGHYVLFLCRAGERVIYYDPYHHVLVEDDIDAIEWISESRHLKKWCINLAPVAGNDLQQWRDMTARPSTKTTINP